MAPLLKGPTEGDLLKFDLDKNYTREVVTLLAGADYDLGSVLGQITATGKYALSPAAETAGLVGAEEAAAVLIDAVDATSGDRAGVVVKRGPAIVATDALVYHASVVTAPARATKIAQLTTLGIVARATA
jgi:hypothetical protein